MTGTTTAFPTPLSKTSPQLAYEEHVNPEWVRLLDLLGMNVRYRRCIGTELHADEADVIGENLRERLRDALLDYEMVD